MSENLTHVRDNIWIIRTQAGFKKAYKDFAEECYKDYGVDNYPTSYPCLISLSLGYRGYHYIECNWAHLNTLKKSIKKSEPLFSLKALLKKKKKEVKTICSVNLTKTFNIIANKFTPTSVINNKLEEIMGVLPIAPTFKINPENSYIITIDYDWVNEYLKLVSPEEQTEYFNSRIPNLIKLNEDYCEGEIKDYLDQKINSMLCATSEGLVEINSFILMREIQLSNINDLSKNKDYITYQRRLMFVLGLNNTP